ncbi:MAG: flagellar biosynthesis anti-sigma factor FlgM [Acidobacteriaceae bacterium]
MNVRNDLQPILPINGDAQVSASGKASRGSAVSTASVSNDEAHLSGAALLASQAASLSDVRTGKVQAIQIAIANGSYSVSSTDVADSLINYMLGSKE